MAQSSTSWSWREPPLRANVDRGSKMELPVYGSLLRIYLEWLQRRGSPCHSHQDWQLCSPLATPLTSSSGDGVVADCSGWDVTPYGAMQGLLLPGQSGFFTYKWKPHYLSLACSFKKPGKEEKYFWCILFLSEVILAYLNSFFSVTTELHFLPL